MSAEVHRLSGLHGHGAAAFRKARAIVDANTRPVVRAACHVCAGCKWTWSPAGVCANCAGRGYIVTEKA